MTTSVRAGRRAPWAGVAAALVFFAGPLAWQALTSLWPEEQLAQPWPSALTPANYAAALRSGGALRALANSALVAGATTALALALAAPAAFALVKLRPRGGRLLLGGALAAVMFPPIASVIPLYAALRALGLLDRLVGLVATDTAFALPLALWILATSFRQIPDEIYRAALADGCTPIQAFRWVWLPLAAPALATAGLLVFIATWNEFLYALTFVSSPGRRTVPVAIALFTTEHVEPWGEIAAASIASTLPIALLVLAFQRRIVAGITAGAVKG